MRVCGLGQLLLGAYFFAAIGCTDSHARSSALVTRNEGDAAANSPAGGAVASGSARHAPDGSNGEAGAHATDGDAAIAGDTTVGRDADLPALDAGPAADASPVLDASAQDGSASGSDAGSDAAPPQECFNGAVDTQPCGNCGQHQRSCSNQRWGPWGLCSGEGACEAGAMEEARCGSDIAPCHSGTRSRSCDDSCTWGLWSACGGPGYVAGTPEICGNGEDENCNGRADEGCSCSPVAVGAGGSLAVSQSISKLVSDSSRCIVYGLISGSYPPQIVVIDTAAKDVLTSIEVPQPATDIDLSPNGQWLVVAHNGARSVSAIDTQLFELIETIPVRSDAYQVEVDDHGVVYYAQLDQWAAIHRLDFSQGVTTDAIVTQFKIYEPDIELSSDGHFLYAGDSGLSRNSLYKIDVSSSRFQFVDQTTWDSGAGFPDAARWLLLSPGGQHVYYAHHQLPASDLAFAMGTPRTVLAEDAAGTFAVASDEVFDAVTLHKLASLSPTAGSATLANHDRELWYSSSQTVYYANVQDYLSGSTLGQRGLTPGPLASYTLSRLLRDPTRNRLYAIDAGQNLVVVIDGSTLEPQLAIAVGATPSDLAIDPSGHVLFVGHADGVAIARIDLDNLAFDRFLATPRVPYALEPLSSGRLAMMDDADFTTPTIVDGSTGAVLATGSSVAHGAMSSTADGNTLFVGESGLSMSAIVRYDVSASSFTNQVEAMGFVSPGRWCVALPGGSAVYYANSLLDASDLSTQRYTVRGPVELVTPDARLATTPTSVINVADGTILGALTTAGEAQAVSPDSKTLYVVSGGAIATVDLTAY